MGLDVAGLLAPVSEDNPVGDDLSYDDERQRLEMAFDTSVSGASQESDVDWREIINLIEAQSARTKDIWLAIYLCRAGANSGQIDVVETGAAYLAGLLEQYWDNVHPQLEEYDFQGRKGPCESLTRIGEFLGPLRRIALLRHPRLGEYSGEDFERFANGGANEDGYGMFRAALEDVGDDGLRAIAGQVAAIRDCIRRVDVVLSANAGDDTGTNFETTYNALDEIAKGIAVFAGGTDVEAESAGEGTSGAPSAMASGGGSRSGPGFSGQIDSREDVFKAIDALIDYYRRREPGSPLPVLLTRARDWVNADFLSILADIAPDGLNDVKRVLTSQRTDDD